MAMIDGVYFGSAVLDRNQAPANDDVPAEAIVRPIESVRAVRFTANTTLAFGRLSWLDKLKETVLIAAVGGVSLAWGITAAVLASGIFASEALGLVAGIAAGTLLFWHVAFNDAA